MTAESERETDERKVPVHPVQLRGGHERRGYAPQAVTMAAYEVYCHVYAPQEALITGECRGGFGVGELVAFLYARSFPKNQWSKRVDEAFDGMKL
jgi:hypothetical protein